MADQKKSISRLEKEVLSRRLGVSGLFAVGYGDLGSSIFYALGITTFYALGAAPISIFLAGIVFACTSLTYAEMTAAVKGTGGSVSFARLAFNDLISFIAGWGLLLDFIVTIAISIFSVLPYLSFFLEGQIPIFFHLSFSVALVGVLYLINFFGVHHSTRISIVLTSVALSTQVLIIIFAVFSGIDFLDVFRQMKIGVNANWSPTWDNFLKGTAMAMVAYTGIESIAALGSETKKPIEMLPRAVIIVMSVLLFMYFALSIISLSVLTPKVLGTTYVNNPLLGIVRNLSFGGKYLAPFVGFLAAALLFVAGNAGLMGASRLSFNMGEYYQLPRFFYQTHKRFRTPVISLGIFAVLASLVILLSRGSLHILADLYNFGAMLAFFSAHVSLIVLRIKQPDLPRPFRSPLNIKFTKDISIPLTAIVGALATLSVWILVIITKPIGRNLGLVWMLGGITLYLLYRRKKKMDPMGQLKIETVKIPDFKPMEINHVVVFTKGGPETETVQIACEIAKMHKAKVTAIHMVKVSYSLPLEVAMPSRIAIGEAILQRAEAIAEEIGVEMETEIVRAREIDQGILMYLVGKQIDLAVLGAERSAKELHGGLGAITERVLKRSPCRVFIASSMSVSAKSFH